MFKSVRTNAVACGLLGTALLSGCGAPAGPASAVNLGNAPSALLPVKLASPKPIFTLDTPVDRIAADPDGKAILERDIPGVMASKEYPLFDDMSLTQIALMSGGRLSKDKLDLVQTDLVQLSSLNP